MIAARRIVLQRLAQLAHYAVTCGAQLAHYFGGGADYFRHSLGTKNYQCHGQDQQYFQRIQSGMASSRFGDILSRMAFTIARPCPPDHHYSGSGSQRC